MEAVAYIARYTNWLLLLVPVSAGAAVTYYAYRRSLSGDFEQVAHFNACIKNVIRGAVIIEAMSGIVSLLRYFYG